MSSTKRCVTGWLANKPLKLTAEPTGSNAAANSRRSLVPIRYLARSSNQYRN